MTEAMLEAARAEEPAAPSARTDDVGSRVIDIISLETQYSRDRLRLESDLESDLGIDSILLTGIVSAICDHFRVPAGEVQARGVSTIQSLVEGVEEAVRRHPMAAGAGGAGGPMDRTEESARRHSVAEEAGGTGGPMDKNGRSTERPAWPSQAPPAEGAAAPPRASTMGELTEALRQLHAAGYERDRPFLAQGLSEAEQARMLEQVKRAAGISRTTLTFETCDTIEKLEAFLRAADMFTTEKIGDSRPMDGGAPASVADRRTMQDFREIRSPDLFTKARDFRDFYRERRNEQVYWYGMPLQTPCQNRIVVYDELAGRNREFVMMASNNYLGLANDPRVIESIRDATARYGSTNTGCRLIGGTNRLHKELERKLAEFKGTEACIVYPSGYSANLGTISALVRKPDAVVSDKHNHMSIVDGARLSGGALRIFKHSDMADLERVLRQCAEDQQGKLIVTDGVFSMHGDVCNLPEIVKLARKYGARVLVDDAHATGVIGRTGSGTSEHFGMKGEVDLELGTFSKTLAGVGGFVCASEEVVEYLRFYANSYVFAATIPAGVVAGLITALDLLQREPQRLKQLWTNIHYFRTQLLELGFDLEHSNSAIIPIVVGDYEKTLLIGRGVRRRGLFCQTVVYPGVGQGEERLRLSLSSEHTREDLDLALEILATTGREYDIIR